MLSHDEISLLNSCGFRQRASHERLSQRYLVLVLREGLRVRKRDLRKLWIARINAAARLNGTTYSRLVAALRKANIELNRKMLSDLAIRDPQAFAAGVAKTKESWRVGQLADPT